MAAVRSLVPLALSLLVLAPAATRADHVEWFNPVGAKVTAGNIVSGTTPMALRIFHSSAGAVSGSATIPLNLPSGATVDSVYLCYVCAGDVGAATMTGVALRTMSLPMGTTTVLNDATSHQSLAGECLGLNVADVGTFGAYQIQVSYTLPTQASLEIGAIGIKLKNVVAAVSEPIEIARSSLWLGPSAPNPFSRQTRIEYAVAAPTHVRLQIVDAAGRIVRDLVGRDMAVGRYTEWWDGRDDHGREMPSGIYYSRVSSDRDSQSERVIRLR